MLSENDRMCFILVYISLHIYTTYTHGNTWTLANSMNSAEKSGSNNNHDDHDPRRPRQQWWKVEQACVMLQQQQHQHQQNDKLKSSNNNAWCLTMPDTHKSSTQDTKESP